MLMLILNCFYFIYWLCALYQIYLIGILALIIRSFVVMFEYRVYAFCIFYLDARTWSHELSTFSFFEMKEITPYGYTHIMFTVNTRK